MKITNKQIRQIIKEELEAVLSEASPLIYGMGVGAAAKKQRAAAKKRKDGQRSYDDQARQRTLDKINRMSTPRPSASPAPTQSKSTATFTGPAWMRNAATGDPAEGLESLLRAKHKAIDALGKDEDGYLPYMYIFGMDNNENVLSRYYDGDMDFHDAIDAAIAAGELGENDIDDESGGFDLSELFPGK
jgi:hypothetical protein